MAKLWYNRIINGTATVDDVPEKYKKTVEEMLAIE